MKILIGILVFLFALNLALADGSTWYHAGVFVNGDVKVNIDFQTHTQIEGNRVGTLKEKIAKSIWVNVNRPYLTNLDDVKLMLISYYKYCYRGECTWFEEVQEINLDYAEDGRFTGKLNPISLELKYKNGYAPSYRAVTHQSFALWINGELIKNPQTDRNFHLDMLKSSGETKNTKKSSLCSLAFVKRSY